MRVSLLGLRWAGLVALLVIGAGPVAASVFDVTADTSVLSGMPGFLVFDFIDGGPPDNAVTLGPLTSDGTQGAASIIGNVTGTGPWKFSDAGPSAFNELQVPFNPIGTSLSFSFTTTDNPADPGSSPDAFSFFILGTDLVTSLVTTSDPTGADSIFLYNIGQGAQGLSVYTVNESGFSIEVTPGSAPAPEPGSLALLVAGVVALFAKRRITR